MLPTFPPAFPLENGRQKFLSYLFSSAIVSWLRRAGCWRDAIDLHYVPDVALCSQCSQGSEQSYASSIPDSAGQLAQQQAARINGGGGGDLEQGIPEDRQQTSKPPRTAPPSGPGPRDATMDNFFKEVSEIKELLEQIKTQQTQLKACMHAHLAGSILRSFPSSCTPIPRRPLPYNLLK